MIIKDRRFKILSISILSILFSTHIIQVINTGLSLNQITLPIIVLFYIAIVKEKRSLYSISLLLMGILSVFTLAELSNIMPFTFFFLALYYEKDNKIRLLIPSVLISSFVISYHINSFDNYINLIEGIIGNLFFITIFYLIFIKQPSRIDHLAKVTPLTHRQLIVLKYLSLGYSRKEMPGKVPERELWKYEIDNFSFDIINAEIAKIKKVLDIDSEFCLGIWYNKKTVVE